MSYDQVSAKVRAGARGWLAGTTLGAPFDGKPDWRNIAFYTPIPDGVSETLPFLAARVYLRQAKDQYGLCDLYGELPLKEDAQRFALGNVSRGLRAPLSGSFENPFSYDGGAMGRGPFWGLLFAGRPDLAAAWAWHDATIDHSGEGVWAACFWAAAAAAAPFAGSISECLQIGEGVLPADSELRKVSPAMIKAWGDGRTWQEAREIALRWDGGKLPDEAVATHAFALIGCLFGDGDFGRTVCLAAGCGGRSVSAGGCAGAVLAAGAGAVPEDWVLDSGGFEEKLVGRFEGLGRAFLDGLAVVSSVGGSSGGDLAGEGGGSSGGGSGFSDGGSTVADSSLAGGEGGDESVADVGGGEGAPSVEASVDRSFLRATDAIARLHRQPMLLSLQAIGDLVAGFRFPDGVVSDFGQPLSIGFRIENPGDTPVEVVPEISGSEGVAVSHRGSRIRVEAMGVANIAAVASGDDGYVSMRMDGGEVRAPILRPQVWWSVGPFDNREQEGYEKVYAPERGMNADEVFSGRSALPMRWERRLFDGCVFDIEAFFVNAPGVIYLATEARFETDDMVKMVVASPVGQVVWVDGEKRNWYQDTHRPAPRPEEPYSFSFLPRDWTRFLVKLTRNQQAIGPTTIYFTGSDGRLIYPSEFRQASDER